MNLLPARPEASMSSAVEWFLNERESRGLSERTLEWYSWHLTPMVTWFDEHLPGIAPSEVKTDHIRSYLGSIVRTGKKKGQPPSASHVNAARRAAVGLWSALESEEYVPVNVVKRIKPQREPEFVGRALTENEIRSLLAATNKRSSAGIRDHALVVLLLETGLRISESLDIKLSDIDWQQNAAKVTGKGRRERVVPLSKACHDALLAHLRRREKTLTPDAFVFTTCSGRQLKRDQWDGALRRLCGKAKVAPFGAHTFRRTCATLLLRHGASPFQVQHLLGHRSLEMTRRYCIIASSDLANLARDHGVLQHLGSDTGNGRKSLLPSR